MVVFLGKKRGKGEKLAGTNSGFPQNLAMVFEVPPSLVTGLGSLWSWRQVPQGSKAGAVPENRFLDSFDFLVTHHETSVFTVFPEGTRNIISLSVKSHDTTSLLPMKKHP